MGAAASVDASAGVALEAAKAALGDKFDEAKWNEAATDGKVSKEVWEKWVADETVAANAEAAAGEIVAAVDTSDDKQISKEECAAAGHSAEKVEEVFANVDADKDGQLTKEELAEAIAKDTKDAAKTTAATAQVAALDTDGDKTKVSKEELAVAVGSPEVAEAVIKAADTDKDGALSIEEVAAACPQVEATANEAIVADAAKVVEATA